MPPTGAQRAYGTGRRARSNKPTSNPVSDALNTVGRFARDVTRQRESFKPSMPKVDWGVKKYGPQAPGIEIGPRKKRP